MRLELKEPPRIFVVGKRDHIKISDCGNVYLDDDEQLTFINRSGKQLDVTAKSWGFYITPSVNYRLLKQGYKTAITRNPQGRLYVKVVDKDCIKDFEKYVKSENSEILEWLDEREEPTG